MRQYVSRFPALCYYYNYYTYTHSYSSDTIHRSQHTVSLLCLGKFLPIISLAPRRGLVQPGARVWSQKRGFSHRWAVPWAYVRPMITTLTRTKKLRAGSSTNDSKGL